jgi:hypothetical protein
MQRAPCLPPAVVSGERTADDHAASVQAADSMRSTVAAQPLCLQTAYCSQVQVKSALAALCLQCPKQVL